MVMWGHTCEPVVFCCCKIHKQACRCGGVSNLPHNPLPHLLPTLCSLVYFSRQLARAGHNDLGVKSALGLLPSLPFAGTSPAQTYEVLTLSTSFIKQSFIKQLLTEGKWDVCVLCIVDSYRVTRHATDRQSLARVIVCEVACLF